MGLVDFLLQVGVKIGEVAASQPAPADTAGADADFSEALASTISNQASAATGSATAGANAAQAAVNAQGISEQVASASFDSQDQDQSPEQADALAAIALLNAGVFNTAQPVAPGSIQVQPNLKPADESSTKSTAQVVLPQHAELPVIEPKATPPALPLSLAGAAAPTTQPASDQTNVARTATPAQAVAPPTIEQSAVTTPPPIEPEKQPRPPAQQISAQGYLEVHAAASDATDAASKSAESSSQELASGESISTQRPGNALPQNRQPIAASQIELPSGSQPIEIESLSESAAPPPTQSVPIGAEKTTPKTATPAVAPRNEKTESPGKVPEESTPVEASIEQPRAAELPENMIAASEPTAAEGASPAAPSLENAQKAEVAVNASLRAEEVVSQSPESRSDLRKSESEKKSADKSAVTELASGPAVTSTGSTDGFGAGETKISVQGTAQVLESNDLDSREAAESDGDDSLRIESVDGDRQSIASGTTQTREVRATHEKMASESNAPIDSTRVVADTARGIHSALRGGHEIHLRLNPDELGGLRIDVAMRDGQLTATLDAERPSSQRLLADNLQELREQLSQQGVQVDRIEVVRTGENSNSSWSQTSPHASFRQQDRRPQTPQGFAPQLDSRSDSDSQPPVDARQPVVVRTSRGKIRQLDVFI